MKTFYYIMHKDGWYMAHRASGKGYTHSEPDFTKHPRLFHSINGAKAAIREWARGTQQRVTNPKKPIYALNDPDSVIKVTPVNGRDANDWKIMEFTP